VISVLLGKSESTIRRVWENVCLAFTFTAITNGSLETGI